MGSLTKGACCTGGIGGPRQTVEFLHSPGRLPRAAGSLGLQSEQVVFSNHRPKNSLGQIMAFGFKQLCGFPRPRLPFGPSVLLVRASPLVHPKLHWERPPLRRKRDHQILTAERLYSPHPVPSIQRPISCRVASEASTLLQN